MEYKAAFVVFLAELIAGVLVFVYWIRRKSRLNLAREEFARFLKAHLIKGSLAQQLDDIANGKTSVYHPKRSLTLYGRIGISMVLGIALLYLVARFTGAGLVIRTIFGVLSILPFIYFISIGIAEEYDDNKISNFEKSTGKQLQLKSREGSIENDIDELLR